MFHGIEICAEFQSLVLHLGFSAACVLHSAPLSNISNHRHRMIDFCGRCRHPGRITEQNHRTPRLITRNEYALDRVAAGVCCVLRPLQLLALFFRFPGEVWLCSARPARGNRPTKISRPFDKDKRDPGAVMSRPMREIPGKPRTAARFFENSSASRVRVAPSAVTRAATAIRRGMQVGQCRG